MQYGSVSLRITLKGACILVVTEGNLLSQIVILNFSSSSEYVHELFFMALCASPSASEISIFTMVPSYLFHFTLIYVFGYQH